MKHTIPREVEVLMRLKDDGAFHLCRAMCYAPALLVLASWYSSNVDTRQTPHKASHKLSRNAKFHLTQLRRPDPSLILAIWTSFLSVFGSIWHLRAIGQSRSFKSGYWLNKQGSHQSNPWVYWGLMALLGLGLVLIIRHRIILKQ